MDEGPITHPGVPQDVYHTLGNKTLSIFVLQRVSAAMVLLIVTIGLFIAGAQPTLRTTPFGDVTGYATLGAEICALLFVIVAIVTFLIGWFVYKNFKFSLGDDSLKIKKGVFEKTEVAIPYRQIQDVDIERDLSFQMMGLSRITILTAGQEDTKTADGDDDRNEGILPAIDHDLAEWLQAELLKRANVQKITEQK
ncbi:MAG: PH domain-containing protein [Candidatus Pacebacteria bacterium]|nr:PH domain-containing protein [Candidatus Paceibacterota bacterium]